jgi:acetyl-CoA decarbonylase/synthase complex subunit delta
MVEFVLDLAAEKFCKDADCDILGLRFDTADTELLQELLPQIDKPLMLRAPAEVLIELMGVLDRPCIIAYADENNYKELVPHVIKGGHRLVIRTPIDINLAKEMNILVSDMGLPLDKIIVDPDIGGLGYGLEYGYSMIEKIKLSEDKYLDVPIISFAVEETLKTKEAKAGVHQAQMLELAAASAVMAAGADIIVVSSADTVRTIKGAA